MLEQRIERTDVHGRGLRVLRPGEDVHRAVLVASAGFGVAGPEVRAVSRIARDWHPGHWWRLGGCERWITTIEVQGVARRIEVAGRHVQP